jgi:CubicO group peptidase (beta-lactamase class C family)
VRAGRGITPETLFNAGSIAKSATAMGVMRPVDQGRLDLDTPIDQYLKRWHVPTSAFGARKVTARRLLNHTSGISANGYSGSAGCLVTTIYS